MSEPLSQDPQVAALLREREGYLARGNTDRVSQVTDALKALGHTDPASQRTAPPRGRRGPSSTA